LDNLEGQYYQYRL